MKALIPTAIIDILIDYIKIDTSLQLNERQEQRLIKVLVELWYFIYTKQIEDTDVKNLKFYVNIDSKELDIFSFKVGNNKTGYKKLINILEFNNIISINNKYLPGTFSKGYRIESSFLEISNLTEFEIDFDKVLSNTQNKSFWLNKYPKYSNLIEDIYSSSIKLDEYLKWLQDNEGIQLKPVIEKGIVKNRYLTKERIYQHFNLALKLNLKNIWVKVSNEGRLYSSISNIAHTAVPFLLIDGMKTIDIDISNSQPLLLTTILSNNHSQYKYDVENGLFYQKVADKLKITKGEFKVLSFKYIFFSETPLKTGSIRQALDSLYPGLMDEINNIKENTIISKKLQTIEADIFVNKIGKLKVKKLLRHDQVIIMDKHYEMIKKYIILEYNKIGIDLNKQIY